MDLWINNHDEEMKGTNLTNENRGTGVQVVVITRDAGVSDTSTCTDITIQGSHLYEDEEQLR